MGVSKVVLNGNVLVDLTGVTVEASNLVSPNTAVGADGEDVTGSLQAKTSADLSVSGATVTAPAGVYSTDASASVASGSATTPATTISSSPTITVSSAGLITASNSKTQSVTPTVSAGYVSSGTAGTITVSGSNTKQLTTQAAQTKYPSTSDQTISSGRYLTGTQTFKGVLLTNLTADNIKKDVVVKVGDSADDDRITSITGTYEGGGGGGGTPVFSYASFTLSPSTNLVTVNFDAMPTAIIGCLIPPSGGTTLRDCIYTFHFVITEPSDSFLSPNGGAKLDLTGLYMGNNPVFLGGLYSVWRQNVNVVYTLSTTANGATLQFKYSDTSHVHSSDSRNLYGIYVFGANIVT